MTLAANSGLFVCLLESPLVEDFHRFCKLVELDSISNIEPFLPYPGPMNNDANGSMAGAGYGTQGQSRVCRYFVAQELYLFVYFASLPFLPPGSYF